MVQAFLSRDGTAIAYERSGHGPALVLVNGALADRKASAGLVPFLDSSFTVYTYDRRGRGSSGDGGDYSIDREIEDLDGLLEIIGSPVLLYGHSSGAMLALEGVLRGLEVDRLALHEPPFIVPGTRTPPPADLSERLAELVAADDLDGALRAFYRDGVGLPESVVDSLPDRPDWDAARALAHTLPYDVEIAGQSEIPYRRLAIETPILVLTGSAAPAWMRVSNDELAGALPDGRTVTLPAQGHVADPGVVAPELLRFFGDSVLVGVAV